MVTHGGSDGYTWIEEEQVFYEGRERAREIVTCKVLKGSARCCRVESGGR